jgi:beta-glucosidase/6-phospho-beta-glucosidase/beta-galactosidase
MHEDLIWFYENSGTSLISGLTDNTPERTRGKILRYLSGFESTHIFGKGKDVLDLTRHKEFVEDDLNLVKTSGVNLLRYSAPWHDIERIPGVYDWVWMDRAMNRMRDLGIAPILDPLHHTSFPEWLKGGFANRNFAPLYLKFCTALAERYPWAKHYTVINEPFVTTWFCGHEGIWYPYYRGAENFVPMLMNVVEAIISVSRMLVEKIPDVCLIHVDAAEKHRAHDAESAAHAEIGNKMRFLTQDLVTGKVDESYPLYEYLRLNGASKRRLEHFRANPARIDVIGLDYYAHCELEWCAAGRVYPNRAPEGLVPTALEYAEYFKLPLMLSETNIRGYINDRISWLKFMVEQCEQIESKLSERNITFEGFCWYPFIDSTDWCSLVREANGFIDPQGIFYLDERFRRCESELSEIFAALAQGKITSQDIPAYHFQSPIDEQLRGLQPLMAHWDWKMPPVSNRHHIGKRHISRSRRKLPRQISVHSTFAGKKKGTDNAAKISAAS